MPNDTAITAVAANASVYRTTRVLMPTSCRNATSAARESGVAVSTV
jgi:hypothetical protein